MKFLTDLLDATIDTILWPFMMVGLLFVGLKPETWQYLYRAEMFLGNNPNYVSLQLELANARDATDVIDFDEAGEPILLTEEGKWAACRWVEDTYAQQIRAAQYVAAEEAELARLRGIARFMARKDQRTIEEASRLHTQHLELERQLLNVEAQQASL